MAEPTINTPNPPRPIRKRIIFYAPRSLGTSILGVVIKMVLLLLPMAAILFMLPKDKDIPILAVVIGVAIGILLMLKSEWIIYPLVGKKHDFLFGEESLELTVDGIAKVTYLKELKSITAFEVPMENGSVKHLVIEWHDGSKIDIFETWVTGTSMAAFESLFKKYLPQE